MSTISYGQKLRDPRWQKRRLQIMQRDGFACRLCNNDRETLNVHHLAYQRGGDPWDTDDDFLVTLCQPCHEEFHEYNPGANWIATLIQAGAGWDDIHMLREAFGFIADGPAPRKYTADEWGVIHRGIEEILSAVYVGATSAEIVDAMSAVQGTARARQPQE